MLFYVPDHASAFFLVGGGGKKKKKGRKCTYSLSLSCFWLILA